jgi:hypothetical protein
MGDGGQGAPRGTLSLWIGATIKTRGEFHDQGDAKWIVIRRQLRGHNDTPCGRRVPGRPVAGRNLSFFIYYQLVILIFNIVPLIMEFTEKKRKGRGMMSSAKGKER